MDAEGTQRRRLDLVRILALWILRDEGGDESGPSVIQDLPHEPVLHRPSNGNDGTSKKAIARSRPPR